MLYANQRLFFISDWLWQLLRTIRPWRTSAVARCTIWKATKISVSVWSKPKKLEWSRDSQILSCVVVCSGANLRLLSILEMSHFLNNHLLQPVSTGQIIDCQVAFFFFFGALVFAKCCRSFNNATHFHALSHRPFCSSIEQHEMDHILKTTLKMTHNTGCWERDVVQ